MIPPWSDCLAIRLSHALSRSQSDGWYRRTITTPRLPRVGYSGLAVWSNQHAGGKVPQAGRHRLGDGSGLVGQQPLTLMRCALAPSLSWGIQNKVVGGIIAAQVASVDCLMSDRALLDNLIAKVRDMEEQLSMAQLETTPQSLLAGRIQHLRILASYVRMRLEDKLKSESLPPTRADEKAPTDTPRR